MPSLAAHLRAAGYPTGMARPILRWLVLGTAGLLGAAGLVGMAAVAWWTLPPPASRSEHPNIVIVTLDTTRADRLGLYGYYRDTSPNLDAFAEQALVFDRFIAPQSTTLPVHTSLFTGVVPDEHGIVANSTFMGERFVPSERLVPLAVALGEHGYDTAGFVSATPLKKDSGIATGFETWKQPSKSQRTARATTLRALWWLRRASGPYFLWVHYFDPHYPYDPPNSHDVFETDEELHQWHAERKVRSPRIEVDNAYDGEIRSMDAWLGRLLRAIDARADADNTLIVVAGDHGEGLSQHGWKQHGHIWNEQLHSPLVIRAPGQEPRRIDTPLSAHDVFPTAFGLLDREVPGASDWLEQTSGADVLAPGFEPRPILSRTSYRREEPKADHKKGIPAHHALTTERYKYIRDEDGKQKLFDLQGDPHELRSIASQHPEILREMRRTLDRINAHNERRAAELGTGDTRKADEQTIDQLEALGYLE